MTSATEKPIFIITRHFQHHGFLCLFKIWVLQNPLSLELILLIVRVLATLCFETGYLCSFRACPGISSWRLELPGTIKVSPASALWVLGLKVCATTIWLDLILNWGMITVMIKITRAPLWCRRWKKITKKTTVGFEKTILNVCLWWNYKEAL